MQFSLNASADNHLFYSQSQTSDLRMISMESDEKKKEPDLALSLCEVDDGNDGISYTEGSDNEQEEEVSDISENAEEVSLDIK